MTIATPKNVEMSIVRIAQASSMSGLSIDTIRYYEKLGMLPPIARGSDGHRRYDAENIAWLTILYWLRATGMSLNDMRRYAHLVHEGEHTVPDRKQILIAHRARLDQRSTELETCREILARKINIYAEAEQRGAHYA